jgi:hypothetical protein
MTDAPEKMWVFPKKDWFNAGASTHKILAAGAKDVQYTRTDIADARTDKLLELMRTSRFEAHTQSCVRGEIPASQIKMLTEMEMVQVGYIMRMTGKGEET